MTTQRWGWIGACSTGTSHPKVGRGCDDAGACVEIGSLNNPTLVAIISDGAGSAAYSSLGARMVVLEFCRSVSEFVRLGGRAQDIGLEQAHSWLDRIRDRIGLVASARGHPFRSFAATLVGCIVQTDYATVIHVGDGACALRDSSNSWVVPTWPSQGEYASTTYFVTDDPHPIITTRVWPGPIQEIAVFSDGLERIALDFANRSAFSPFFEKMFMPLRKSPAGRNRSLSNDLRIFLDSQQVTARTDDDKALIMARIAR